jgi:hypothetical protein
MLAGPLPKPAEPQLSAEEAPLRVRLQLERVTQINLIFVGPSIRTITKMQLSRTGGYRPVPGT